MQWSRSDHLCVAGQVLHHAGDRWRLTGAIHALAPARPSNGHQPFSAGSGGRLGYSRAVVVGRDPRGGLMPNRRADAAV